MTPEQLAEAIEEIIDQSVGQFKEGLESSQSNAYVKILAVVKELSLDSNGNIKKTAANLKVLKNINKAIREAILTKTYTNRVERFLRSFFSIEKEQKKYFETFKEATQLANFKYLDAIKTSSIEAATSALMDSGISQVFEEPIKNLLQTNITSGGSFASMVEDIKMFIIGNEEVEGRLLRYASQITSDSLHVYAGQYQQAMTQDLGLVFYKYVGGLKDTSRNFCIQRKNKYFHKEEVKDWSSLSWDGKISGTNQNTIFSYVGGYRCQHLIIGVSQGLVPDDVLERAKEKGFI